MSFHHYPNNKVSLGRSLLQPTNQIQKHHIIVQIAQGSQQRMDATHAQHVVGINKQDHICLQMQPNRKINKLEKNAIAPKKLGIGGEKNVYEKNLKKCNQL